MSEWHAVKACLKEASWNLQDQKRSYKRINASGLQKLFFRFLVLFVFFKNQKHQKGQKILDFYFLIFIFFYFLFIFYLYFIF